MLCLRLSASIFFLPLFRIGHVLLRDRLPFVISLENILSAVLVSELLQRACALSCIDGPC